MALASNIAIGGLRPAHDTGAESQVDIQLSFVAGPAPRMETSLCRWAGRYGLELGISGSDWLISSSRGAAFLIAKDGRQVRAFCDGGEPTTAFMDILVRRVLPRVTLLFGRFVLHAAAICKNERALLLLGPSKAGKSTMSTAMSLHHSWSILSDDMCVLDIGRDVFVAPTSTSVCLWPDSRGAMRLPQESCRAMPAYDDKVQFEPKSAESSIKQRVSALIYLERSSEASKPELAPIAPTEGLIQAARQVIHFDPNHESQDFRTRQMEKLSELVRAVPSYRLTYPNGYALLPDATNKLEQLLS